LLRVVSLNVNLRKKVMSTGGHIVAPMVGLLVGQCRLVSYIITYKHEAVAIC
jgi:hypothetical protein